MNLPQYMNGYRSPPSIKHLDLDVQQQPQINELMEHSKQPIPQVIEIIKNDGTIYYSFRRSIDQHKTEEIRYEVIESARKLLIQSYAHEIIQLLVSGYYVYFKTKLSTIIIVVSTQSYSNAFSEYMLHAIIQIYDESIFQTYQQPKSPRSIHPNTLAKLQQNLHRKMLLFLKHLSHNSLHSQPSLSSSSSLSLSPPPKLQHRSYSMPQTLQESSKKLQQRIDNFKRSQSTSQKILQKSQCMKQQSIRLNRYIASKNYVLYFFIVVCFWIFIYAYFWYY